MRALRPNCKCCQRDLLSDAIDAYTCSFDCTSCIPCKDNALKGPCTNCGGELARRPIRPAEKLVNNPPSLKRVLKAGGCAGAF
ncbi:DUF1272 domain-containing protein [Azospirillum canadense]|uniref:DUF1272 domain-containing protein n=1 Tax=Azospirillum canadense TaxID=403962 RepID=UPI002225CD1A|nr:DUF1272 domain-containing protein [Azospirillum canadense]MCW2243010.1 hypothetical protein [Azospirillum canadense]